MKKGTGGGWAAVQEQIKQDIRQHGTGVLAVIVLYFLLHAVFDAFCPSVIITGFPCPGCGMTRAVLCLLRGQFQRSWALNPAAGLWAAWALWFAFERYIRGTKSRALMRALYGIALFMITAYVVRMVMYFPDRPPYVYTRDNLFSRLVPFYGELVKKLTRLRN